MRPRQTLHTPKKRHKNRILWLSTTMLVLFVVSVFGLKASIPVALAMEQQTRCGLEEHVHDDDCYINNVIICQQKAHSHSNNCYLLLLEDNDVNMLLTAVSQSEDKNLESLISGVLGEAVRLNEMGQEEPAEEEAGVSFLSKFRKASDESVMTASFAGTTYAGTEVSQLNDLIETFEVEPAIVLNEGMAVPVTMELDEPDENNGIATAAVEPNTSGMYLNVYTYIDGEPVCIWTDKYTVIAWGKAYKESDLAEAIAESLAGYGLTAGNYSMRYTLIKPDKVTTDNTKETQTKDSSNTAYTVFGKLDEGYIYGEGYPPVYLYLFDAAGNAPLNFSPEPETESITVDYDVNFSTSGYSYIQSVTDAVPALLGEDLVSVEEGEELLVGDVTDRNVTVKLSTGAARYGTVHFLGWKVGNTDTIIKSASMLSWDELTEYASDGTVRLTGQWDYHMYRSVNFFMSYRQNAATNIESWTPVIFNTYVGGVDLGDGTAATGSGYCGTVNPKYGINHEDPRDMDAKNLALYDKQIRELHGESASGVWLAEFPTDRYIFNELKKHASQIYVDNELVAVEELNENHYTIRWIAFKASSEGDPATWHVDGILVRKPGAFEITKTFAGNQMLIEAAKNGFSIEATNGEITHTFNLDNAVSNKNGVYKWKVEDVKYDELWTITESPPAVSDAISYHEWNVVDPYNTQNKAGTGKEVTIRGITYPVDVETANLMQVNFNNIYYQKDSLMLKKEDEKTGQALRGAEFELWQNGSRMTFDYNATTGLYEYNQNGNGASRRLSSDTANGYINISTTGFSYENGEVTVKEVKTPAGYGAIDDIVLGKDGNDEISILSDSNDYARYKDGLLIIQNSSDPVDVTVKKEWKNYTNTDKLPVIVQLLANGDNTLASELIGINGVASVTLDEANSYMHTWYGLPVYANGEVINWSVREIQIGDEKCKTDYSFANWISAVSKTTDKNDADEDTVLLTVTNMPKAAAILMLTKTDWDGTAFLPGAEFMLKNMNNGATATLVTDAAGGLTFYNLKYETLYELTETKAPEGYWELSEPVYFTIAGDGTIQITQGNDSGDVVVDGKYSMQVKNRSSMPMPETGGGGTWMFTGFGMLLLFGLFTYQKKNAERKRRRRARRTSR